MFFDELDMLECRLVELYDIVDAFVLVEADVTHTNQPKPLHFQDNAARFERFADKIVPVAASDLPDGDNPWLREIGQREWVSKGLDEIGVGPDDVIMHGDIDEIPSRLVAELADSRHGLHVCIQEFHPFAVDWRHPQDWQGTVIGRRKNIDGFGAMRETRYSGPPIPNAGHHFTWVSDGVEAKHRKMLAFSHPEIIPEWGAKVDADFNRREGIHVDGGTKLTACEVDATYPQWIRDRNCPEGWFRP